MDTTTPHKKGKLSLVDEQFIKTNVKLMSVEKIAEILNRTVAPIQRYIDECHLISAEMSEVETAKTVLRSKLHGRNYWYELKEQFTDEELNRFTSNWVELLLQFREDVLFAEELQIKQYLTIDILIARSLKERKHHMEEIDRLQKIIDDQYKLPNDNRDVALITAVSAQLSFARAALTSYSQDYKNLLDKYQQISKDLKATREQRIKRIEDSKSTFAGFLRALEDEDTRERMGDEAELMKLAKDKAKERLGEYHTYIDGKIDQPLLNADTVKE